MGYSYTNENCWNCKQALDNIIEKSKRSPKRIYSDEGKEFLGAFQKYWKVKKIQQILKNLNIKLA